MRHQWIIYILGAVLSTMASLIGYNKKQPPESNLWRNIYNFYFDGEAPAITTVLTFSLVWLLGSIYIEDLQVPGTGFISGLPNVDVVAFFLGALGEFIAPIFIKSMVDWIIRKWFS